jgi:hypothetical protein
MAPAINAALLLLAPSVAAVCDKKVLAGKVPKYTQDSWCKVLDACPDMGMALLNTAANCTDHHKGIDDIDDIEDFEMIMRVDEAFGGGYGRVVDPRAKMCHRPGCMMAVEALYMKATTNDNWLAAVKMAKTLYLSGLMGIRRRLTGATGDISDVGNVLKHANSDQWALAQSSMHIRNAAEVQLSQCLNKAKVKEGQLGLPVSVASMTGQGKFVDVEVLKVETCYTMRQWFMARLSYYSGMDYAQVNYDSGTNVGMIIAIVIGSVNLVCLLGCCGGFFACIRYKACYFCMKDIAPECADCLVEIGCGPPDAERLNNEVVLNSGDVPAMKPAETEMAPATASA